MDVLAALIPSVVVVGFFIALLVTALRATDKPARKARQSPRPSGPAAGGETGTDVSRDAGGADS